jgi:RNA-directed DNA polymerase
MLQRKLNQVLQAVYPVKNVVHGFARGRAIVTNARMHVRARHILNINLKDSFPSVNFGRVRGMFLAKPYQLPEPVATVLAQLCTHKNSLAQGAPTSPVVSNMVCARLDSHLKKLARENGCIFSRYADDLAQYRTLLPGRSAAAGLAAPIL